jgi:hypothetical protein
MKISELLEEAIPRGEAERIADLMGYSTDYVRKWRQDKEAGAVNDSARRDPVTNLLIFFDALKSRGLGEWIPVILEFIQTDLAGKPKQVEDEMRAISRRQAELAEMVAAAGRNGQK